MRGLTIRQEVVDRVQCVGGSLGLLLIKLEFSRVLWCHFAVFASDQLSLLHGGLPNASCLFVTTNEPAKRVRLSYCLIIWVENADFTFDN